MLSVVFTILWDELTLLPVKKTCYFCPKVEIMLERLKKFEDKQAEIVFEWKDPETEARGWVVINSLRGGAAGGGTRMRKGLDKREVESLAKTMEIKFTVAGPPIGGAKSGIDFDPFDPRKEGVLRRWYAAVTPLLKHYYGTGGDMNVDEIHEVIPYTEDCGVWHPQEGVFNGHFQPREAQKIHRIGQLRSGVLKVIEDTRFSPNPSRKYVVADMITGYGVAVSLLHYYSLWGGSIVGKRVIVQGWGNVGSAAAYYLSSFGASIVGIIDRAGGLMNAEGFTTEEVRDLFLSKKGNTLHSDTLLPFEQVNESIWGMGADIFIPCAGSRLVSENQLEQLISSGVQVISCGANVPFADPEIFFGPIANKADQTLTLIPDFIANCGMARVFAYLMANDLKQITDEGVFQDVSEIIYAALSEVHQKNPNSTGLARKAFEQALDKLER
jgi:glutamate dehydrogenase/leucine dehydrogenase